MSLVCRIFSRGESRLYTHRTPIVGSPFARRNYEGRANSFGATESLAIEIDTVVHVEHDTHIQDEEKADLEALSLSSKSNTATHHPKPGLS